MTEDELLEAFAAARGIPPAEAEPLRRTFFFQQHLLAVRVRELGDTVVAESPRWLRPIVRGWQKSAVSSSVVALADALGLVWLVEAVTKRRRRCGRASRRAALRRRSRRPRTRRRHAS